MNVEVETIERTIQLSSVACYHFQLPATASVPPTSGCCVSSEGMHKYY